MPPPASANPTIASGHSIIQTGGETRSARDGIVLAGVAVAFRFIVAAITLSPDGPVWGKHGRCLTILRSHGCVSGGDLWRKFALCREAAADADIARIATGPTAEWVEQEREERPHHVRSGVHGTRRAGLARNLR